MDGIFLKRIFARLIDVILPCLLFGLSYYLVNNSELSLKTSNFSKIIPIKYFLLLGYLITNLTTVLFTKNSTLGDLFIRIKLYDFKKKTPSIFRIILREFYVLLTLWGMLEYSNGWIGYILSNIPLYKSKTENYIYTPLDLIFRLKYYDREVN
ncbi:MAG: RDD family protein [Syntrophorhabdus sp. PtaB.Bin027]|nr:MAG: RDD family protein [Syntrophorhabdus sp. PtaB.Bin027]